MTDVSHPVHHNSRVQKAGILFLGILVSILSLYVLQDFVKAILWAAIFAVAVRPLYVMAERRWKPSGHNIALPTIFTLVIALVFIIPLIVGVVKLGEESKVLMRMAIEYQKTGIPVPDMVAKIPFLGHSIEDWWLANLSDPAMLSSQMGHIDHERMMSLSGQLGGTVFRRAISGLFTLMTLFVFFHSGDAISDQLRRAATRAFGHSGEALGAQIVASIHGTVDGLVLVGIAEGVILGIAYAIAGVPHTIVFGAITAVAAMVPFGAPLVFGAAALYLLSQGAVAAAIAIIVVGFLVGFIADHAIRPVLIGGATKLPFLLVMFGILGGVENFGLIGLFMGPAIMSVAILLWREWVSNKDPSVLTHAEEATSI